MKRIMCNAPYHVAAGIVRQLEVDSKTEMTWNWDGGMMSINLDESQGVDAIIKSFKRCLPFGIVYPDINLCQKCGATATDHSYGEHLCNVCAEYADWEGGRS